MAHKHSHHDHIFDGRSHRDARYKETVRVTVFGAVIDVLLGTIKIVVGTVGHSQALIADGIHSFSDLATDFVVLYAAKHSSRDADAEHPYGHGRIETVATVILGVALIGVALGIAYNALQLLYHPERFIRPSVWVLVIAMISAAAKEFIYHYTMRTARKYNSAMLRANAWHSRTDAISSIIVIIGVAGTMAGLPYLDALAAVGVAYMIAKIGWDLGWHSLRELIDTGLDQDRVDTIRQVILQTDGVRSLHLLRTRMMGGEALVDVHVQVEPTLTASEGHYISETVRHKLIEEVSEVADVMVHIDTEDDQAVEATLELPDRAVALRQLQQHFAGIESAGDINKTVLHYVDGRIHVELYLPLTLVSDTAAARSLQQQYNRAISNDPVFADITLYFH